LSTTTTTAICNTLPSMTCVVPASLITFAPLISVCWSASRLPP
jgi:hypothetical protein